MIEKRHREPRPRAAYALTSSPQGHTITDGGRSEPVELAELIDADESPAPVPTPPRNVVRRPRPDHPRRTQPDRRR